MANQTFPIQIPYDKKINRNLDSSSCQEISEGLPGVDAMRNALIHTEKGLKDAVIMLRQDMMWTVSRIADIEVRLNQLTLECRSCPLISHQKVITHQPICQHQ